MSGFLVGNILFAFASSFFFLLKLCGNGIYVTKLIDTAFKRFFRGVRSNESFKGLFVCFLLFAFICDTEPAAYCMARACLGGGSGIYDEPYCIIHDFVLLSICLLVISKQ